MATKRILGAALLLAALGMAAAAFAAQNLTAKVPAKGRLEKGDPKVQKYFHGDTYTYNAQAGEEVWIAWRELSVGLTAHVEIRGPGGFALTDYVATRGRLVRFPTAGRYSILVWDTSFGDYELTVFPIDATASPTRFASGQVVRGALSPADPRSSDNPDDKADTLTYAARAGETVSFHLEGEQARIGLKIRGPDDKQYGYGFAEPGQALDVGASFAKAGDYTLTVAGYGGNYTLEAKSRQAAAEAAATPLALGQPTQVRYSAEGAVNQYGAIIDVFKVTAQRGQRLAVIRNCACQVAVRGPDGQELKTVASSEGKATYYDYFQASRTEFTAPVAGEYRIEAPAAQGASAADATLQVVSAEQGEAMMAQVRDRVRKSDDADKAKVADAIRRGDALLSSGDNFGASSAYLEALGIDVDNIHANFNAGVANFRIGGQYGYTAARDYFQTVVRLDPNNQQARANIDLAIEADAAYRRNSQAAYEQQQRENSQVFANALNAFVAGVQLGNQINAARAAPPPAPAPAPAPSSYAQPSQQASSSSQLPCAQPGISYTYGSRDCGAASQNTHNPANDGTNCVRVVPNPGNWGSAAYFFVNGCGWPVVVAWDRNSQGRYTSMTNIALGGHHPTGFAQLPSPFPYIACKKRPEIGADIYNDNGRHICVGPAA